MLDIETFYNQQNLKRFFFPGRIFWGTGCRHRLSELIETGGTVALFVDAYFLESDFIRDFRERHGGRVVLVEPIGGMPRTEQVTRLIGQLDRLPDWFVSVGGGSSMDTAKAVMAGFLFGSYDGIGIGQRRGIRPLAGVDKPAFVCLPTTAGTGADASRYYVIYSSESGTKVYGRSWRLVADWILLDPALVRSLPERLLVPSAFDAFVHLFESFLCRFERSWFGEMLSLDGIPRILRSLDRIVRRGERDDEAYLELLYAATMAGVAVSNIRTGMIHEAAGALLEHTTLSHPETLFVFFRETCSLYRDHMGDREALLARRLSAECPELGDVSLERIVRWWEDHFERCGITGDVVRAIGQADASAADIRERIYERVHGDRVWVEKEGPLPLDDARIRAWIAASLARFGL